MSRKEHWEKVYTTKQFTEVSWYQQTPATSLRFIEELGIQKNAAIMDVGGGDSYLVDHLLNAGFTNITVLDISATAIEKAKQRLGAKAKLVNWVVSDITAYKPDRKFDCWHDRAAFHFLTTEEEIHKYLAVTNSAIANNGKIIVGTFSETGSEKCSGLPIKQYSESSLTTLIKKWFDKIKCIHTEHRTPFNTIQNFLFCSFKKHQLV
jgi:ubiquinone/menaquinone biosynthesis C-methylase UbiE